VWRIDFGRGVSLLKLKFLANDGKN